MLPSCRAVDPDPGVKIFQIKTEKGKEIDNDCNCKVKLHKAPLFLTFFYVFYDYRKLFTSLFFTKFVKLDLDPHSYYLLDPDPHSEQLLDPDPQKMNADPQP